MVQPLLIGESNPYSRDPSHALLPWPVNASGGRLARLLHLTDREYLRAFDRMDLLPGPRWSIVEARRAAALVVQRRPEGAIILLGTKVAAAFAREAGAALTLWGRVGRYVVAPHPSGLNRIWHDPEAPARLRALLAEHI